MTIMIEILFAIMAIWLAVTTVASCMALWVLWKAYRSRLTLPGVRKNKATKEALRSLDD